MKSYTPKAKPYSNYSKTMYIITWCEKTQYTGTCHLTKNLKGKYLLGDIGKIKSLREDETQLSLLVNLSESIMTLLNLVPIGSKLYNGSIKGVTNMTLTEQTFTINVPIKVNTQDIEDILEMAFVGADYWINDVNYSCNSCLDTLMEGKELVFSVPEDDADTEFKDYTLTLEKLLKGIEMYCAKWGDCLDNATVDTGKIDVADCDLILQYALFGEQVFG